MSWWSALYDDWLAEQLLVRDPGEVASTLAFLGGRLGLERGMRVLDQCCGIGSVALPLAARGFQVVGVDQAEGYVARAAKDAQAQGLDATFVAADACRFVPSAPVHAAFNWWTSFGYFDDDDMNLAMLARARDALVPGGRFALDTMNVAGVLRGFQRDVALRRETPRGEVLLLRESRVDLESGRMIKRWTYFLGSEKKAEHPSSVKLYMPDVVAGMLRRAGFTDVEMFGGLSGEPLSLDSPRLVAVARRPA
ncbi:MAG TPA: methyltransferase domain-containing protein [Polyangiaceae bacterium]|nr:methyltransferase domain-containing protein [Polyangiaceae bacterium]